MIQEFQKQVEGNYYMALADHHNFAANDKILNYVKGIEIKMTEKKGRGLFATEDIPKAELIIVEKAVASVCKNKKFVVFRF